MAISTIVSTSAQLLAALAQAHSGDTILLAPGNYSPVQISNFQSTTTLGAADGSVPVIIRSEFSNQQAVLSSLHIDSSSGLSFGSFKDSTAGIPIVAGNGNGTSPISVTSSSQITFDNVGVYGHANNNYMTTLTGMIISHSSQILVTGSSFQYLHNGIVQFDNNNVVISSNRFGYIDDDAMHSVATSNITITKNFITDQHYDASDADHPDGIQFYTQGATNSARNITITYNTITRGTGNAAQGIFLKDEVGDLPYQNVVIQGNTITGESYNGIYAEDVQSSKISANNVTSYADFESGIKVLNSNSVILTGNSSSDYQFINDTNLVSYGNITKNPVAVPTGLTALSAVPEPAPWIFMLLGVGSLGLIARRARLSRLATRASFAVPT